VKSRRKEPGSEVCSARGRRAEWRCVACERGKVRSSSSAVLREGVLAAPSALSRELLLLPLCAFSFSPPRRSILEEALSNPAVCTRARPTISHGLR